MRRQIAANAALRRNACGDGRRKHSDCFPDYSARSLLGFGYASRSRKTAARLVAAASDSNGGRFTYLLWAMRGEKLTAVAPSAAAGFQIINRLKPLPCLHF